MVAVAIDTKFVDAAGFKTRYLEAGDPKNPKLMLVHDGAFGTTAELCWRRVIEDLSGQFHIFAPEMLGWGGTDKVVYFDRSPYDARIPHVAAFVAAVGIEKADYVGVSFGGSITIRASIDPANPWRIRKAISLAGSGGPYRLRAGIEALADYTPSLEAAGRLTALIAGTSEGMDEHVRQRFENSLIPGHWEALMAPRLKNPSIERPAADDGFLDALSRTKVPALFVESLRDPLLEKGWAEKLAVLSPLLSSLAIDASHEANIECPEKVVEIVHSYFSS